MAITTTKVANSEPVSDGFLLNSTNQYYIDVTGGDNLADVTDAKWARLAKGIASVTPAGNETANNDAYYDGGAYGSNDITGKRPQWSFTAIKLKTLLQAKNLPSVKLLRHVCYGSIRLVK